MKEIPFQLLQSSEAYIKEHINWRAELRERSRKEIPEIPLRAINEALVNSLCHRDYTIKQNNEIAIFKDRIEIYNPGEFPEGYTPNDFIKDGERSIPKNPKIANILYLSRDIERWGSGIKRIYDACKVENIKVEFKQLKRGFLVTFYRLKERKIGMFGQKDLEEDLEEVTNNQKKMLQLISKNPKITQRQLAKLVKINEKNIRNNIAKLKNTKFLIRIGSDKGGYWKVLSKKI